MPEAVRVRGIQKKCCLLRVDLIFRRECKKMRKIFITMIIAVTLLLGLSVSTHAATVTQGIYTLETSGTTAKIKSVNLNQYGYYNLEINKTIGGYTITSIGSYAFTRCNYLKKVILPDSVTTLDEFAFAGIESVELSRSVKTIADGAFSSSRGTSYKVVSSISVNSSNPYFVMGTDGALYNKSKTELVHYTANATSFTVPSTVKKIRGYAFAWSNISPYRALTTISLPYSVTDIGNFAFFNCRNLTTVNFPYNLRTIGNYAFAYTCIPAANLPDTITSVGEYAFAYVETLTEAYFPDWIPTISIGTFEGCINLENFTLPSGLTKIDDYAFYNCSKLKAQPMPKGLTVVDWAAFQNCDQLTEAVFGDELKTLSTYAFYKCDKLERVRLSSKLSGIGEYSFADCVSLKEVIIPEGITFCNPNAFTNCSSLESISLPDSLTFVNANLFKNCTALKNVKLPSYAETLYAAFSGCTALEKITIPGTVTKLSANTFSGCTALKDVYFDNTEEVWGTVRPDDEYWQNITVHFLEGTASFVVNGEVICYKKVYSGDEVIAPEGVGKLGCEFAGWAAEDGGEVVYKVGDKITDISSNAVFYGVWERSVYTETENYGDGYYIVSVTGAPVGSKIILAAYSGADMVYARAVDYNGKSMPCFVGVEHALVKVFIWQDYGVMLPLCEAEIPEI